MNRYVRNTIAFAVFSLSGVFLSAAIPVKVPKSIAPCELPELRAADKTAASHPLAHVRKWDYLINGHNEGDKMRRLIASDNDMVTIDDPSTMNWNTSYDIARDIRDIKSSKGVSGHQKLVIAYANIGQAEDYRTYWRKNWKVGHPAWILSNDPEGWPGNFPVAYWKPEWQAILKNLVEGAAKKGFDGVAMDWAEGFSDETVAAAARRDGVDARAEMIALIGKIKTWGKAVNPDFVVIVHNAVDLGRDARYRASIDAVMQEQVFFDGAPGGKANSPRQGDCRLPLREGQKQPRSNPRHCRGVSTLGMSSEWYVKRLNTFLENGIPVFVMDYALKTDNAAQSYRQNQCLGFRPNVTARSLDDLTKTPMP